MKTTTTFLILIALHLGALCQGLVVHYPLDSSGNDISGNDIHGTLTGATSVAGHDGSPNGAMQFVSGAMLEVTDTAKFNFGIHGELTTSAWFKTATTKTYSCIYMCGTGAWMSGYLMGVNWEPKKIMFGIGADGFGALSDVAAIVSEDTVNDGEWHHIAVTVDTTTEELIMYLDGSKARIQRYDAFGVTGGTLNTDSTVLDITGVNYKMIPSTASFMVGNSAWGQYFDGEIDDVRIYNDGLSASDIQDLVNSIPTGVIDDVLENGITLYPNPSNGVFDVRSDTKIKTIQFYDVDGRLVDSMLVNAFNPQVSVNIPTGIYIVRIFSEGGVHTRKLIME